MSLSDMINTSSLSIFSDFTPAIVENYDVTNFNVQWLHEFRFPGCGLTDSDDFATR
jgi:hypothetical protein